MAQGDLGMVGRLRLLRSVLSHQTGRSSALCACFVPRGDPDCRVEFAPVRSWRDLGSGWVQRGPERADRWAIPLGLPHLAH